MTDAVADAARAAAVILAPELGPNLSAEVEVAWYTRDHGDHRPGQYDPAAIASLGISAAGLIVSIAQLAQANISDRRNRTAETSPDSTARQVRISLREHGMPRRSPSWPRSRTAGPTCWPNAPGWRWATANGSPRRPTARPWLSCVSPPGQTRL